AHQGPGLALRVAGEAPPGRRQREAPGPDPPGARGPGVPGRGLALGRRHAGRVRLLPLRGPDPRPGELGAGPVGRGQPRQVQAFPGQSVPEAGAPEGPRAVALTVGTPKRREESEPTRGLRGSVAAPSLCPASCAPGTTRRDLESSRFPELPMMRLLSRV